MSFPVTFALQCKTVNGLCVHNDSSFCDGKWTCSLCRFSATSKIGFDLQSRIHKKQSLLFKGTPIKIPPNPKQRKQAKSNKIAPLFVGDLGDFPLDQPLSLFQAPSDITSTNVPLEDVSPDPTLLNSFLEPLDALLD
ncbi:hypothetical protein NPIL_650041 [Nephila pilipes]|uniref:Uncharacterized protein n=1 Tax=Nephila pilipes TaxID=299642 RepID=A0A8X6P0L1_NEPPI|nr:hypothetical protein NPIL_650041 [Nephila pilipes]